MWLTPARSECRLRLGIRTGSRLMHSSTGRRTGFDRESVFPIWSGQTAPEATIAMPRPQRVRGLALSGCGASANRDLLVSTGPADQLLKRGQRPSDPALATAGGRQSGEPCGARFTEMGSSFKSAGQVILSSPTRRLWRRQGRLRPASAQLWRPRIERLGPQKWPGSIVRDGRFSTTFAPFPSGTLKTWKTGRRLTLSSSASPEPVIFPGPPLAGRSSRYPDRRLGLTRAEVQIGTPVATPTCGSADRTRAGAPPRLRGGEPDSPHRRPS